MRVKLGDVAFESRETIRGSKQGLPIVGLEHITPSELTLSDWDINSDNTFTKLFTKGQMLFGRRRAYLKKAAVAPFQGICSGDITVIGAIPEKLLPELLPFIIQNDTFFDYAVEKSAGSLSPRVKWDHLSQFEFNLPSLNEQLDLADLLWAANETQEAYKELITITDELVKSQFVEMFGDPLTNPMGWDTAEIGDLIVDILAGQSLNGEARQLMPGEKAVLKVSAVTYGYFKADEYKVLLNADEIKKYVYPQKGDLLFSRANTREMVGATALVEKDYPDLIMPDKLWKLVLSEAVNAIYMKAVLSSESIRSVLSVLATGTSGSMYNISMEKLRKITIPKPPLVLQTRFAEFVLAADKSKFELQCTIDKLEIVYKALFQEEMKQPEDVTNMDESFEH